MWMLPLYLHVNQKSDYDYMGSEHSYRHEIQNPTNNSIYPWSRTSVICLIPVLSLNLLTTTGDRTTDRLHILDMSPGGTSPEENISLRRGGDIDHLLPPPLLGHHLQTLVNAVESIKDPNNLTGKEEED